MGIPHLISNLQPFAVDQSLSGSKVVIDGPSLAYHIYFICLKAQRSARNPFEASPSYEALGEEAIKWLNELERHGAVVTKIYFDGFLPESKFDTRLKRLMQYTLQLTAYNNTCPNGMPSMNDFETSASYKPAILTKSVSFSRLASFPALPFIVPAVIEKLKESVSYHQITDVIPAEADSFCAFYLRKHGGVVLTSDSDLLVHDLGTRSSVCFLKDLSLDDSSSGKVLSAPHYNPSYIMERLNLTTGHGLRALAFQMSIEPHWTLPQLQQTAKKLEAAVNESKEYDTFIDQYSRFPIDFDGDYFRRTNCFPSEMTQILRGLDPRISEFVLQFPFIAKQAGMLELRSDVKIGPLRDINVFLPFLLDCPTRTSAWEPSTPIRQLAYGLMNLILPVDERITAVIEYRRRLNNSRGREWQLPTFDEIHEACAAHLEVLENIRQHLPGCSNNKIWRVFAIHQEMCRSQSSGKPPLAVTLSSLPDLASSSIITWDEVQFSAQIQGFYYSLRIVQQILAIVICSECCNELPRSVHDLKLQVDTIASLKDLPSFLQDIQEQRSKDFENDVEIARGLLYPDVNSVPAKLQVQKIKKRAKRKLEQAADASSPTKTNNRFDILNIDY